MNESRIHKVWKQNFISNSTLSMTQQKVTHERSIVRVFCRFYTGGLKSDSSRISQRFHSRQSSFFGNRKLSLLHFLLCLYQLPVDLNDLIVDQAGHIQKLSLAHFDIFSNLL